MIRQEFGIEQGKQCDSSPPALKSSLLTSERHWSYQIVNELETGNTVCVLLILAALKVAITGVLCR